MTKTLTIARRELTSLFFSPIAYVVMGLFALGTILFFFRTLIPGLQADLRSPFQFVVWLMIVLVPAISMRLVSEEFRAGTIESLMTAPISDAEVIVGKWLGALGFFAATLLFPFAIMVITLEINANPDYGPILTGLFGLLLVGGLYLAIGTFASSLTQNQIIAFLLTAFIICVLLLGPVFLLQTKFVTGWVRTTLSYVSIYEQFFVFAKGLVDLTNVIYFASSIALFLFLAVIVLQSRRWR